MTEETRRSILQKAGSTVAVGGLAVVGSGSATAATENSMTIDNSSSKKYEYTVKVTGEVKKVNGNTFNGDKVNYTLGPGESDEIIFTGGVQSLELHGLLTASVDVSGVDGSVWDITGSSGAEYSACFDDGIDTVAELERTDSHGSHCINGEVNSGGDRDTVLSNGPLDDFSVAADADSSVTIKRD